MDVILLILALLTFLFLLLTIIEAKIGFRMIKNLKEQFLLPKQELPSISIIFSALNEETSLAETLESLLSIDYPKFEIIAMNDRSTDRTGEILDYFSHDPKLIVKHIEHLEPGWLGKNHALHIASSSAQGDWLLFTDADVIMKKDILLKSISYAITHEIDHLTIYEHHIRPEFWLKVLMLGSYITYLIAMKPWRIRLKWSRKSLGHGAFNLVRKTAYINCGGHQPIAMQCFDDLKLGALLKHNGYKQDTVDGRDLIEREWYSSFKQMVHGLQKNSFAYFDFNLFIFLRDFAFACIFFLWPILAVFTTNGWIQWINLGNCLLTFYFTILTAKQFRLEKRFAILYPLSIVLMFYTVWNSMLSVYKQKGVIWRDTFYSLQELRNKK